MAVQLPSPKDRNLYLAQQVDQDSINKITRSIIDINDDDKYIIKLSKISGFTYNPSPIKLHIDSYGGQVYQCLGLLGVMRKSEIPIHTIVTGCAMSCGFLISIAGHRRFCYDSSTLLYHQVGGGVGGKLKDMQEQIIEVIKLQDIVEKHTIEHTKLNAKQLKDCFSGKKDWHLNAKEALKYGCVDEII